MKMLILLLRATAYAHFGRTQEPAVDTFTEFLHTEMKKDADPDLELIRKRLARALRAYLFFISKLSGPPSALGRCVLDFWTRRSILRLQSITGLSLDRLEEAWDRFAKWSEHNDQIAVPDRTWAVFTRLHMAKR